jgi:hypothetical protein
MTVRVHTSSTHDALMIDSGAEASVFCDPTLFSQLMPATTSFVCFGPGEKLTVDGTGSVSFVVRDVQNSTHTVTLPSILYVPTQPHNILSLHDILSSGGGVNVATPPYYIRWKIGNSFVNQNITFVNGLPYTPIMRPSPVSRVHTVRKNISDEDKKATHTLVLATLALPNCNNYSS